MSPLLEGGSRVNAGVRVRRERSRDRLTWGFVLGVYACGEAWAGVRGRGRVYALVYGPGVRRWGQETAQMWRREAR